MMGDLLYLILVIVFLVLSLGLTALCGRLEDR
jgi:hypothetical protein